jgi:predicted aldo/keto reductase-like oxidoreductase
MQYRKFGKLDWRGSALGFGCMRLPIRDRDPAAIDEPAATRLLHYAIDHGVNYLDTGHHYHRGQSEPFLGRALQGGYRDKVRLATKLPPWQVEEAQDFDRLLNEQLAKLQTDYIDFYLLHGMNHERWPKLRDLDVLEWAERAIADGRIHHLGFSFHDEFAVFREIVDAYDKWTVGQIQYNYMDIETQAGTRGLKYAASKGLAVVIMEPLLAGKLATPPPSVQALWNRAPRKCSPANWALQWLWQQPEVSIVLSGMNLIQHLEENLTSASASGIGGLTEEELALVDRVREAYLELGSIPCTACGYCMPCPNGVDIPCNFEYYNMGLMYGEIGLTHARWWYDWLLERFRRGRSAKGKRQAVNCIGCRECEDKCPQGIPISEWMPIIHQVLGEGQSYEAAQQRALDFEESSSVQGSAHQRNRSLR